jgi:hypothetical protein
MSCAEKAPRPTFTELEEVPVRKVVAVELMSVDGVMESPEEWQGSKVPFACGGSGHARATRKTHALRLRARIGRRIS